MVVRVGPKEEECSLRHCCQDVSLVILELARSKMSCHSLSQFVTVWRLSKVVRGSRLSTIMN